MVADYNGWQDQPEEERETLEVFEEGKLTDLNELAAALVKAQGSIKAAAKSATNPHLRSRYSTLADVWEAVRPALAANGLAVVQGVRDQDDAGLSVWTLLLHTSGQSIENVVRLPLDKPTAQAVGSAITYGRRYGLASMLGVVADEDDDGHTAATAAPVARREPAARSSQDGDLKPASQSSAPTDAQRQLFGRLMKQLTIEEQARGASLLANPKLTKADMTTAIDAAMRTIAKRKEAAESESEPAPHSA